MSPALPVSVYCYRESIWKQGVAAQGIRMESRLFDACVRCGRGNRLKLFFLADANCHSHGLQDPGSREGDSLRSHPSLVNRVTVRAHRKV